MKPDFLTADQPKAELRTFATGAQRGSDEGKINPRRALSAQVQKAYCEYIKKHRHTCAGTNRGDDNWRLGMPMQSYEESLARHVLDWSIACDEGRLDAAEDLAYAVMFNLQGWLHERLKQKGAYEKKVKPDETVVISVTPNSTIPVPSDWFSKAHEAVRQEVNQMPRRYCGDGSVQYTPRPLSAGGSVQYSPNPNGAGGGGNWPGTSSPSGNGGCGGPSTMREDALSVADLLRAKEALEKNSLPPPSILFNCGDDEEEAD